MSEETPPVTEETPPVTEETPPPCVIIHPVLLIWSNVFALKTHRRKGKRMLIIYR